ncbi:MAG TPA: hypothetical protein VF384_02450 [Planctomycetota bacterium]
MKNGIAVCPLLLGVLLSGGASAQVDATHSVAAPTRTVRVAATMRHVGARTTHAVVAPPSAAAAPAPSTSSTPTRAVRLPPVHFRHS